MVQWRLGSEGLEETVVVTERLVIVSRFLRPLLDVLTLIAWWRWQLRAAHNLRAFSGRPYRFTPGWTIGWHFIPIFNFFKPYQAMKEIFKASDPLVPPDDVSWRKSYSAPIVAWWWGLCLANGFFIFIVAVTARLPSESIVPYSVGAAGLLASLSLCLTAAAMIRAIDRNQRRRANLHVAGETSALDSSHIHRL